MTDKTILADKFMRRGWGKLNEIERNVIESLANHSHLSRNVTRDFEDNRTLGEKVADKVAAFGGSWTFILIFGGILIVWVGLNSFVLVSRDEVFDPYPYILLNLFLSMVAAMQAPIIMMSQNRQAARDRLDAANDYQVNLKSELEIRQIHEKIDELRDQKWMELIEMQNRQIRLLEKMLRDQIKTGSGRGE